MILFRAMESNQHLPRAPWVLILVLLASLAGIFDRDLWTPDEPRDAAISMEMGRSGNYVIPRLAGVPFIEKPPLYFAVASIVEQTLGRLLGPVGAIRLTSALWGLGVLGMTFLLVRRLSSSETAFLSVVLLGTMVGFVENMHWIRVDAALAFFVIAAVWAFGEVFAGERAWMCLPAGLFTGLAFLSKGTIGPVLIAIGWAALSLPRWIAQRRGKSPLRLYIVPHLLALAACLAASGTWILLLRTVGGKELWNEWFWQNQVGRMQGTTTQLGHLHPGVWWYYLQTVAVYTLPWLPLLAIALGRWAMKIKARPREYSLHAFLLSPALFALLWGGGSVLVLTQSVTKRDLYLLPVLPAFALLCAIGIRDPLPRWASAFYRFFLWLCAGILLLLTLSPPLLSLAPEKLHSTIPPLLTTWTLRHLVVALACIGAFLVARSRQPVTALRLAATMALVVISLFALPAKAVDEIKNMGPAYRAFAEQIPAASRPRVASWNLSETASGELYFHGGLSLTRLSDPSQIDLILSGNDPRFDSVVLDWNKDLSEVVRRPYRLLAEARPGTGRRARPIYWIQRDTE